MTRAEQKATEAIEAVVKHNEIIKKTAADVGLVSNRLDTLEKAVAQMGKVVREMKITIDRIVE